MSIWYFKIKFEQKIDFANASSERSIEKKTFSFLVNFSET